MYILLDSIDFVGDGYGFGEIFEKVIVNIVSNLNVKCVNNNLMVYVGLILEKMVIWLNDKE